MIPLKDDNPTKTYPFVTVALIAVNTAVFVYEASLGELGFKLFIYKTAAIPIEVLNGIDIYPKSLVPVPLTLLSSLFIHGGFFHLAGNMLYLWIFGDNIEDRFGHLPFLVFYLASGVIASMTHVLIHPNSTMPLIGASGAVAGILGAYFLLYPRAQVLTLVFLFIIVQIVRLPALVFLGLWFAIQLLSSSAGGNIAWYAHIGGFVAGVAFVFIYKKTKRA